MLRHGKPSLGCYGAFSIPEKSQCRTRCRSQSKVCSVAVPPTGGDTNGRRMRLIASPTLAPVHQRHRKRTHLVFAAESDETSADDQQSRRFGLATSYAVERFGEQSWLFATPFLLMSFQTTGNALMGPAVYGISRMWAQAIFSPAIGSWMDKSDRLPVMSLGTAVQMASLASAAAVCFFLNLTSAATLPGNQQLWIFSLICGLGVLDSMGKILTGVAIFRDWVPELFGQSEKTLSDVNTQLARLDLFAEVLGPLAAGLIFSLVGQNMNLALLALGCVRILCLLYQLQFFRRIISKFPNLAKRKTANVTDSGAKLSLSESWKEFVGHQGGVQLVVIAYALLYLTVLSPHGLVLTAYLSTQSLSPAVLSVFRGCGALVGVVGVTAFQLLTRRIGLPQSAQAFITFQAFCSLAAAGSFFFSSSGSQVPLYVFMLLVVLARFGLYGFEVGALQLQQMTVPVSSRGAFGSVEKSLCSVASLVMYATSAAVTSAAGGSFLMVICGSAGSICAAALVCRAWLTSPQVNSHLQRA